jgi:hypothetical protein
MNRVSKYNRNEGITGKAVRHKKLTAAEFSALADKSNLTDEDIAYLVGTRPDRVAGWRTGAEDVPFYLCWAMDLLEIPSNLERAIAIAQPRAPFRPEFISRGRIHASINAVTEAIRNAIPEAVRVAEVWERDNPGQMHPNRSLLAEFHSVQAAAGEMNIGRRLTALTAIAGSLGMGIDVNAEIEKANAPFIRKLDAERRERNAAQKAAAPDLPNYRK